MEELNRRTMFAVVYNPASDSYYELVTTPATWEQARNLAQLRTHAGRGGQLAVLSDSGENQFVYSNLLQGAQGVWIGGRQADGSAEPDRGWQWVDGTPWSYTRWASGEPNNAGGNEKYLDFGGSAAGSPNLWNDSSDVARPYVVEYPRNIVYSATTGSFYELVTQPATWEDARLQANSRLYTNRGGHLAVLSTAAENQFVYEQLLGDSQGVWIGGFQPDGSPEPDGGWQWVDGTPWSYTRWASGEPSNTGGGEKYLDFGGAFAGTPNQWNDSADTARSYVVEYSPDIVFNPTNKSYYQLVRTQASWGSARDFAQSLNFAGRQGHLAVLTSAAENQFVFDALLQGLQGIWIGGYQQDGSVEPLGGWNWVTRAPWNYTRWADGEPNNHGGNEKYLDFGGSIAGTPNYWNDSADAIREFVVEFAPHVSAPTDPDLLSASDTGSSDVDNVTADNTPTFVGSAASELLVRVFADGVEVGQGFSTDGAYSITTLPLPDGTRVITVDAVDVLGNVSTLSNPLGVVIDTVGPTVTAKQFSYEVGHAIRLVYGEDVGSVIQNSDLVLQNLATGAVISTTMGYVGMTATFTFPGFAAGILPDGDYRATIAAGNVTDVAGNPLAGGDEVLNFFVLAGDANRNRRVDIADFAILAARFNRPGTFSQGDFNYTGAVEIGDFAIMASKFNTGLPATFSRGGPTSDRSASSPTARAWTNWTGARFSDEVIDEILAAGVPA